MQAEIVPFHWAHVDLMDLRDQERSYIAHMPDWDERVRHQHANSVAYTFLTRGVIVCSYGFTPMWPGVWEIWMLTARQFDDHVAHHARSAAAIIDVFMQTSGAKRLQGTVNCTDPRAERWLRFLQFSREGVLKSYGPDGSDYLMMARYPDGGSVRRRREQAADDDDDAADGHAAASTGKARRAGA